MLSYNHNLYLYGGAGAKQNDDFCCAVVDKSLIYKYFRNLQMVIDKVRRLTAKWFQK